MKNKKRKEQDLPQAIAEWGWKYHHLGIPTEKIFKNERYIPHLKMYVSGFETSPFGVEWMRFEENSPIHPLIKKIPHLAFEVENVESEIQKHSLKVIEPPGSPSDGVIAAMIEHNEAPVELIEFRQNANK